MKSRIGWAVVLMLLVGAAVGAEVLRDRAYGEPVPASDVLYVRSGDFLGRASVGNKALLADLYWIRAVQYYGGQHLSKEPGKNYDLLYPLLDISSTLDPRFSIVYRFGAMFLAERYPDGPDRMDLSVKLLEKGIRADPSRWRYLQDLGFIYYWYAHDYVKAAQAFERGASVPGAPLWMRQFAAVMYATGGNRRTSRLLWQELAQTPDNDWLRRNAQWRLQQLDALDQIDHLERIVAMWTRRTGEPPASWEVLVRGGWLRGEPVDPSGTPYEIERSSGRVTVRRESKLFPLPVEP